MTEFAFIKLLVAKSKFYQLSIQYNKQNFESRFFCKAILNIVYITLIYLCMLYIFFAFVFYMIEIYILSYRLWKIMNSYSYLILILLYYLSFLFQSGKAPWKEIIKSRALFACVVAHMCNNWQLYTLLTSLPTFMKAVLKFDIKSVGYVLKSYFVLSFPISFN